jgi:hypothetical protein
MKSKTEISSYLTKEKYHIGWRRKLLYSKLIKEWESKKK